MTKIRWQAMREDNFPITFRRIDTLRLFTISRQAFGFITKSCQNKPILY